MHTCDRLRSVRARRSSAAALVLLAASHRCAYALTFTDVTSAAGLVYQQRAAPVTTQVTPWAAEQPTGGAAPGDYDRDGFVDLIVTRADAPPILFRNNGDGTFTDVTSTAGDLGSAVPTGSNGVVWGDVDNDGDLDLYLTAYGTTRFFLFINDGNGSFTEEGQARGAAVDTGNLHFGMGAAFGDYDLDGYLDLFVTEWRAHPLPPEPPLPGQSHNRLLRNLGAQAPGHFEDVTLAAGVNVEVLPGIATSALGVPGFSPGFVDFDLDGWPDLTWVADWGHSRLFWSNGDGTFTDGTVAAGVGLERSGMGSTQDDFDGDGLLDWLTTSIYGRLDEIRYGVSNQLYLNNGDRTFANVTAEAGVADGGFGWGASGFDFDNDGDIDVINTNGFSAPGHPDEIAWATDRTKLFENRGDATFDEVGESLGIVDTRQGKGLLTFDYDRDGDLDVFIADHGGTPVLYRNDGGNEAHWLQVVLHGTASNPDGIGAQVFVRADLDDPSTYRLQHVSANSNFVSHDELIAHFGLGTHASTVDRISVRWPSGTLQIIDDVAADQRIDVTESADPQDCARATRSHVRREGEPGPSATVVWRFHARADDNVLGDPTSATSYRLSIEDRARFFSTARLSAGAARWETRPHGFRYWTPASSAPPVVTAVIRQSGSNVRVRVVAAAASFTPHDGKALAPVVLQLRNDEGGCWQATESGL